MMNEWTFADGQMPKEFKCSVLTGACRSGKTTLGNLLGTCRNIDHVDEHWTLRMVPVLAGLNAVDRKLAKEIFTASAAEIFNETLHLRHANFRPNDLSSIYRQKSMSEILLRLTSVNSRQDALEFARERDLMLLLNLAETSPFVSFFTEITGLAHIILVVRKSDAVVKDLLQKRWFSDSNIRNPTNRIPHRVWYEKWYLPWWVSASEEDYFLSLCESDRCFYYWNQFNRNLGALTTMHQLGPIQIVYYEDLVANPLDVFEKLAGLLGLESTEITETALAQIKKFQVPEDVDVTISDKELQTRIRETESLLGY